MYPRTSGTRLSGGRDLAQARRLERGVAGLRWIVVAFGVAQTDRGPGIPLDEQERVFERLHQTDAAATRRSEGAGLGLYIAKQLVETMGGRIELRSEPGAGSTFRVILPETSAPAPAPLSPAARAD